MVAARNAGVPCARERLEMPANAAVIPGRSRNTAPARPGCGLRLHVQAAVFVRMEMEEARLQVRPC